MNRHMPKLFIVILLSVQGLYGCGTISNTISKATGDGRGRMNPPKIHIVDEASGNSGNIEPASKDPSNQPKTMADIERLPITNYYAALLAAQQEEANISNIAWNTEKRAALSRYVDSGIVMVKTHCLRWFQRLNDDQRKLEYANSATNVITELGTTLLGLGNANKYFITGYGALNTTRAGLATNYNDSFLLAPNAKKVKSHIFSVLDSEADKLIDLAKDGKLVSFMDAYERLERYADLCTHATAREITETALDQTTSTVDEKSKRINTVATFTKVSEFEAVSRLQDEIKKKEDTISNIGQTVEEIRAERDRSAEALATAKHSLEATQIQGVALSKQLDALTQERKQQQQLIEEASKKVEDLAAEVARLKTENESLRAK